MAGTPEVADVTSAAWRRARPRIEVTVDRAAAARAGLTEAAHRPARRRRPFRGTPARPGHPRRRSRRTWCCASATPPAGVDALRALPVPAAAARCRSTRSPTSPRCEGPVQVTRIDGERSVTVSGTATGVNLGATTADLPAAARRAGRCRPARRSPSAGSAPTRRRPSPTSGLARAGRDRDRLPDHGRRRSAA